MTNEEIKYALKSKCKIKWDNMIFQYAKECICWVDKHGNFKLSLELVDNARCLVRARADQCEIIKE